MADIISHHLRRPKWTDRQHIAASDLTAEQRWQDEQLTRLRRLALGWGVMVGLEVSAEEDGIVIAPGYGITAAGSEVYIAEKYLWSNILDRISTECGNGKSPCSDIHEISEDETIVKGAWLVLVPKIVDSCPRPTLPDGCAHPGSAFAYSRQTLGYYPELRCELPEHYLRETLDCKKLSGLLQETPVAMPTVGDDILPLAWITCDQDKQMTVAMEQRRKLLPLSIIQDLITCCDCFEEGGEPTPAPVPSPDPGSAWKKPEASQLDSLIADIEDALPGGATAFELSYAELFAEETPRTAFDLRSKSNIDVLRRFATSLLVRDKETLDLYLSEDYEAIIRESSSDEPLSRLNTTVRRRMEKITLGTIWTQGNHGYAAVQANYGQVSGEELIHEDSQNILETFDKSDYASAAALYWIQDRIIGLLKQR